MLTLVGCGESTNTEATQEPVAQETPEPVQEVDIEEETTETEEFEEVTEEVEEPVEEADPNTIEADGYTFVIKEHEVLDSALFDDKKILAVHLTFTNNTNEPANIWMTQSFKAEQETDATVELLMGANGQYPDDYYPELVELGSEVDIKPGATVDAVIGYELIYPDQPVYIRPFISDGDYEIILNNQ